MKEITRQPRQPRKTEVKVFTIISCYNDRETKVTGTMEELNDYFSYTLLKGNSYNKKIHLCYSTPKTLVNAINKSYYETCSYNHSVKLG